MQCKNDGVKENSKKLKIDSVRRERFVSLENFLKGFSLQRVALVALHCEKEKENIN